jgi:quercetin dioxygenase-like cupin family protein
MGPGRSSALKLLNDETGEAVMVFEETAPPPGTETTYRLHHDSDEVAYVLSGEITCKVGDVVTVGGPGVCAFIPRAVPHAWKNTGTDAARVLFLYTPGGAGKFFEEREQFQRSGPPIDEAEAIRMRKRHGWEIVGPPPFGTDCGAPIPRSGRPTPPLKVGEPPRRPQTFSISSICAPSGAAIQHTCRPLLTRSSRICAPFSLKFATAPA